MADGAAVDVLQTVPCEPKDFNTARCRIAPRIMKVVGAVIGSPIRIKLKSCYVLCSAWPRNDGIDNVVQFDAFITQSTSSEKPTIATKESLNYNTLKVPDDFCVQQPIEAKTVVVSVFVSDTENDLYQWCSLPKALQDVRNERKMRALLRNHTVTTGCCIRPRNSRNKPNRLLKGIEKIVVESTEVVDSSDEEQAVYVRLTDRTKIIVDSVKRYSDERDRNCFVIAGLETAAQMLKELVQYPFLYSDSFAYLGLECPKGVLLQGVPGVGKTLLVRAVTSECGAQLITLNATDVFGPHPGESEENLRKAFGKARTASKHGPCVLFIDEVDALCPKRGSSSGGEQENRVVAQLLTLMDGLDSRGRLVVIGATNRPNAIDPALRRPGRFDREIVIGVPTITQRLAILKAHTKFMPLAQDVDLAHLAEITLGYVGADLASLCREATFLAIKRNAPKTFSRATDAHETLVSDRDSCICMSDFELAMCHIVPSTYRGLEGIVDVQPVRWEDIGGLAEVKLALQQAIEWPLKYPEAFARMGLVRPRGVLLYGPPGCCKTTLVRAAASSCHVTFLSLSCAQLFSPYVGDAERRIRELFVKARSTAPSILFLDELDVIAGKRSDTTCSGVEARVLSALLNEMDGIGVSANIYESKHEAIKEDIQRNQNSSEENISSVTGKNDSEHPVLGANSLDDEKHCVLKQQEPRDTTIRDDSPNIRVSGEKTGVSNSIETSVRPVRNLTTKDVLVIAATNRPGAIDEAFVRPGRIDRVIYVPPPDTDSRLEILKVHCRRCPVADDVDLQSLAEKTEMFTGADLENLCREAALYSLEDQGMSASTIENKHFVAALAAVRPSLTQSVVDKYKEFN